MAYFHPAAAQLPPDQQLQPQHSQQQHHHQQQQQALFGYPVYAPEQLVGPAQQQQQHSHQQTQHLPQLPQHPPQFQGLPRRRSEVDQRISSDSKPRLSKEQHDYLEAFFRQQPKPSTSTKKGFADQLNVPLDKVNNWFQNRRAKVKQEAKKAHNASLFYSQHHAHMLPSQVTSHEDNGFTGVHDDTPRHSMVFNGPMTVTSDFMDSLMINSTDQVMPHGEQHSAHPSIMPMQDTQSDVQSAEAFETFFGLSDPSQAGVQPNFDAVSDISKQFGQDSQITLAMQRPRFSIASWQTSSSSLMTGSTGADPNSSRVSTEDSVHEFEGPEFHPHSMPSSASSISQASSSHHAYHDSMNHMLLPPEPQAFSFGPDGLLLSSQQMLDQSSMFASQTPMGGSQDQMYINNQQQHQFYDPCMVEQMNMQMMMMANQAQVNQDHVTSQELGPHAMQTDAPEASQPTINAVDEAQSTATVNSAQASRPPTSNLAARRHHRPAALGLATARSISYTAGTDVHSPNSLVSPTSHPADHHLRRIKSSVGVISGRVTKSGYSSSQRSPMTLNFAETALGSPIQTAELHKLSRTNSMPSVDEASEYRQSSHVRDNIPQVVPEHHESAESVWESMPSTAGTAPSMSAWSHAQAFQSPPVSPMDIYTSAHGPAAVSAPNEPQSAPAWQTQFALPIAALSTNGTKHQHSQSQTQCRPSTAGGQGSPLTSSHKASPKSACRSPTESNSSGTVQGSPSTSRVKSNTPHYGMFQVVPSKSPTGSPSNRAMTTPERAEPRELEVHHYTPPGHEDTNELLKQKSPPQPKKYDWISHGPSDYSPSS